MTCEGRCLQALVELGPRDSNSHSGDKDGHHENIIDFNLFSLLISASVKPVLAQECIRIATAGGLSIVPVGVMQDKELSPKRGVTADIVQIASSPVAIQATLSGEVEAIVTSAATLVTSKSAAPRRWLRQFHEG